ncbi:hypothetical protein GGTG_09878 [Gaeumannomyces tritici R3-111a-1]|uniref:Uncharacterized protein n=1 Tax=Gaeumannomyces tritici (strain R3-111a-1) TaxID=644352 RepID=J3P8P3_GAET3|nr:hypothetical protein GGTG_09878 [Gaeumannomyces tritici R3-111a-1]EJT73027.1 hypothetical protein GGTG_09878 [Gaeumannomyces tritici R3-111a-1]
MLYENNVARLLAGLPYKQSRTQPFWLDWVQGVLSKDAGEWFPDSGNIVRPTAGYVPW